MSLRVMVAVALCLGLSAPVATAAADHETTPTDRGAELSSGGDPYFPLDGNRGYDVDHYRVTNTYDPDTDRLAGRTRVRATATEALDRFSLDLVLAVDRVLVDGRLAEFTEPHRHELLVDPEGVLEPGETFTVEVSYHGRPASVDAVGVSPGTDLYFHRPGETVAMGEPQNGAWWFAANEIPRDKASFDVTIRVPRGVEAISNGALVDRDAGQRWTTWRWRLDEPVATYMAFFAAGQFRLDQGSVLGADGGSRSFAYAVSRNLGTDEQRTATRKLRMTADVVEWLEDELGDYPYGEIGGLVTSIPSGYALETATRPVYPWGATLGGGWRTLLVHEQAHQWFGNDVAVERWRDIWLNEGFATYVEWWYDEDRGGATVAERLEQRYDQTSATSSFWDVRISDPGPSQMFSNPIYVRGAMTLAALRARIGDLDFTTLLDQWLARNRNGHGTGTAFRALAEEVSGEDLTGFFQHWLDDQVKPAETAENGLL